MPAAPSLATVSRVKGRVWGPDLFAWAWDLLEDRGNWRQAALPTEIEHLPLVLSWRDRIRNGAGWVGDDLLADIEAKIGASNGRPDAPDEVLLWLLVALDRAYFGVRLNRPMFVGSQAQSALIDQWEIDCSLQRAATGLVLRKGAQWRAGGSLAHYCNDLSRVSPGLTSRVRLAKRDVLSLGEVLRSQTHAELTVAFVPTLTRQEDLDFVAVDRDGARLFIVDQSAGRQASLRSRMEALVGQLEDNGVNLALLPETVLSEETLEALRQALRSQWARSLVADSLPALRLVVAGVGGGSNTAAVLGGDGTSIFRQEKIAPWRLDRSQQERYGLTKTLGGIDRLEDIRPEGVLHFLDDPGFGRLAVLICEDLARGDTAWQLTTAATPNLVVSPVCDDSLETERWAFRAVLRVAEEPGALGLVGNSAVLSDRRCRAAGEPTESVGIGIVCHPDDYSQTGIVRASPRSRQFEIRRLTWEQAWG